MFDNKRKKNHYNVKFLKGYGHSVSQDNKIVLKNGLSPFSANIEQEEWFITNLPYEKIELSGKVYVSTEALVSYCATHYITTLNASDYEGNLSRCQSVQT
ncbi:MAG: hypothetical protein QXW38_09320 [Candidatus Nitrosotenuis sp.]